MVGALHTWVERARAGASYSEVACQDVGGRAREDEVASFASGEGAWAVAAS